MASVHKSQFVSGAHAPGMAAVYISQAEYDELVKVARQYACLRQNLLKGGVDDNIIAVLSQNESPLAEDQEPAGQAQESPTYKPGSPSKQPTQAFRSSPPEVDPHHYHRNDWRGIAPGLEEISMPNETANGHGSTADSSIVATISPGSQLDRVATRTIQLLNLADNVTHADITAAIRGGQLLDIFIRARDRTANVSFVYGEDAKAFFARARRNDLYIKNKRVELKWSDRQFILPGHVAHNLRTGASRNLVIRDCDSNLTEHEIRCDLEHIHNLMVIGVKFLMGDCYIETNSVHNAIFAKTCMMSRVKYKYSRIEWAADECTQPPIETPVRLRNSPATVKTHSEQSVNRFHLLDLDSSHEEVNGNDANSDDSDNTLH